ncbi:MAG: biotin--[Synergistaceae bacterium]|nr:biotin--[acetyl-CoA-carboxylase] ligase [Synergistaceae bacterium]
MKNKILTMLEDHPNEFVSGEAMAEQLGVTRAAVWKTIKTLQNDGYKIRAVSNRGYSLDISDDRLSQNLIRKNLSQNSKVAEVIFFDSLDSTNNYAKKIALKKETSHGTLVVTDHQTAGRGRYGHIFESPARTGLYMSLILRPKIEISKFQMITIADAVAVCLAIEDLYEGSKGELKIKWVNDLFFRGKKITGILTEAVTNFESGEIESVVTGIGVNVSTKNFTDAAGDIAGSIFEEGEKIFSRNELCARIADYVMNFAEDLDAPELINAYRERSLLKVGEKITYMKDDKKFSATVRGIDDNGGLVITNENGEEEVLRSGEVNTVRNE